MTFYKINCKQFPTLYAKDLNEDEIERIRQKINMLSDSWTCKNEDIYNQIINIFRCNGHLLHFDVIQ